MGDYIVCRCEEVYAEEIERAIDNGAQTNRDIKMTTRAGMGICQGRTCRPILQRLIPALVRGHSTANDLSHRSPVRPVRISDLLLYTEQKNDE